MKWVLDHNANKIVSNLVTWITLFLVMFWCRDPWWHGVVLGAMVMLTNVAGHSEGLTRDSRP